MIWIRNTISDFPKDTRPTCCVLGQDPFLVQCLSTPQEYKNGYQQIVRKSDKNAGGGG